MIDDLNMNMNMNMTRPWVSQPRGGPGRLQGGTQLTECGACERAAGREGQTPGRAISQCNGQTERFLSREGSGQAARRIPGAHEATLGKELIVLLGHGRTDGRTDGSSTDLIM